MKKLISLLTFLLTISTFAQVTTSKIQGTVTDDAGVLFGATVVAKHAPTGTVMGAMTQENGNYAIPNLRVGGPYTVTFSFVGYKTIEYNDIYLQLGKTVNIDVQMTSESQELDEVVIKYTRNDTFNSGRTGSETSVGKKELTTLPTISRSQADFTRLEPTASDGSFGGRNDQYNNFSLDGSIFNNPFGLDAATPGGQTSTQPISLDAIDQIQVSTAPYDVSLSGFTGAAVNAVTKSGTNTLSGTVYGFYRNQDLTGGKIKKQDIFVPELSHFQTGFSVGGPIVKNKLFFFINAERENRVDAGSSWIPNNGDGTTEINEATVLESDMIAVQNALANLGYDTGAYRDFTHLTESWKGIMKLDYNINDKHRMSLIYNFLDASQEHPAHPTALGFRGPSSETLQFENSGYQMNNIIHSFLAEVNSSFGNGISNKFQAGYTSFSDFRNALSDPAPAITIQNGQGSNYIIAGYEPFSIHNVLDQRVYQTSNKLSIIRNAHNITLGASFEKFEFGNAFNLGAFGYDENGDFVQEVGAFAAYADMSAFLTDATDGTLAAALANAESVNTNSNNNGEGVIGGWNYYKINVGQVALYAQDEISLSDNFKLTLGLRTDKPLYFNSSDLAQDYIATQFSYVPEIKYFDPEKEEEVQFDSTQMPTNSFIFSPRLGVNWDVTGDNTFQVRGGTGIFTGRLPFVWVGNQSGAPNWWFYQVIDPDFQWPTVWKSSLGIDKKFEGGLVATIDLSYTDDIKAAHVQNWGLKKPSGTLQGVDSRPIYTSGDYMTYDHGWGPIPVNAFVLSNSNQGYSYNASVKIQKSFENNLTTSIAYNYMESKDVNSIEAEITGDAFAFNPVYGDANKDALSYSKYGDKHRVVGMIGKSFEYNKFYTNIATIFEYAQGGRFNYTYGGDINGDGSGMNDLLYIPTDTEVNQMTFDAGAGFGTEAAQRQAFENYIQQDNYLSANRGKAMERYGALSPWRGRWDVKVLQGYNIDSKRSVEFSLDILNLGNLFNSNWGVVQQAAIVQPLGVSVDGSGNPTYTFNPTTVETFVSNTSLMSRWQIQGGLRFNF